MGKLLVSIVVPVFNVGDFLDSCVQSVINQTSENWEMILVDDGSQDESGKRCDFYAGKDQRIKVIHQKNKGLSGARNTGLDQINGEYVLLLDGDDELDPDAVRVLSNLAENTSPDMIVFRHAGINETGEELYSSKLIKKADLNSASEIYEWAFTTFDAKALPWNKLYRRSLFDHVRYPEGRIHEDEFVFHHLMFASTHIICIEDVLYRYRTRENSIISAKWTPRRLDSVEAFLQRAEAFCEKKELHKYVPALINQAMHVLYLSKLAAKNTGTVIPKSFYRSVQERVRTIIRASGKEWNPSSKFRMSAYYMNINITSSAINTLKMLKNGRTHNS